MTLDKELQFIRSYINLMALRLSDNTRLTVSIHDGGTNGLEIAPMMFISLVENAFKHGVSNEKPSYITIELNEIGEQLICRIRNSRFPKNGEDRSGSGIGLKNLQKRLEMIYPGRYTFEYGPLGETDYQALLTIRLQEP